jgi:hypothetical protein
VEKTGWRCVAFSSDDEHVAAGVASREGVHKVYMWNRTYGKLERVLDGEDLFRVLFRVQASGFGG